MPKESSDGFSLEQIDKLKLDIITGEVYKRFEDEYYVFDLLKVLCEDNFDKSTKFELLIALEQYGYAQQDSDSVDQVVSSLLNIFQDCYQENDYSFFSSQLLITATSLLIQSDLLKMISDLVLSIQKQQDTQHSDVHLQLNNILLNVISKVSRIDDRQLRGSACQCLMQLEEYAPGELLKKKDVIVQLAKEEKTEVCQDYLQLVTLLLKNQCLNGYLSDNGTANGDRKPEFTRNMSVSDTQETKQLISYIIDNTPYFTVPGLWSTMSDLKDIVLTELDISPLIFKPLVLHHMSTMDPSLFHLVLYLQRTFSEQILTDTEETVLMSRMITLVNHPVLAPAHRLLTLQWIQHFKKLEKSHVNEEWELPQYMVEKKKWSFYPTIFDGIDSQSAKLRLLSKCFNTEKTHADLVAVILQKSSTYLQMLVKQTGRGKAVIALFKILHAFYKRHASPQMAQYVKNLVLDVATELPQYIPHVLDFITAILEETEDRKFYIEILKSLHNQVVGSAVDQILVNYEYYLMVLNRSTKEEDIMPKFAVKFLCALASCCPEMSCCEWKLGQSILAICRNILCYQSTDKIYTELGDFLHTIMITYEDVDICDKARLYYALLTGASDTKIREILKSSDGDDVNQALTTFLPGTGSQKDKTEIISLDCRVFQWKRTETKICIQDEELLGKEDDGEHSILDKYLTNLKRTNSALIITFSVSMVSDFECDCVQALTLSLKDNSNYRICSDCRIASLEKGESKDVELKIKLMKPEPFTLKAWITFATITNQTCTSMMEDTDVSFMDILHPVPWSVATCHSIEQKKNFFECLWDWLTCNHEKVDGVESVKVIKLQVSDFLQRAKNTLQPYQVETDSEEHWYGIFLSPCYHLLLKIKSVAGNTVVSVATDYWACLPFVDTLLNSVITS